MKKILTFIAIIISLNAFAQVPNWHWARGIGSRYNDSGLSIASDASGHIYATGYFRDTVDFDPGSGVSILISENYDAFITKVGTAGNLIWAKSIGGSLVDGATGRALAIDPINNNIYLTGDFSGTVDFDPGISVFNLTSLGGRDIFISKFDSAGDFIWAKRMGGPIVSSAQSIALDPLGNVCIAGYFAGTVDFDPEAAIFNLISSGYGDIFVCKLNSSGNLKWAKAVGGAGNDEANSIAISSSGNIYTTGTFNDTADFDPGSPIFDLISAGQEDIFISGLDSSGNFVWAKQIGSISLDFGESIAIDTAGSGAIYITGYFFGTGDFDPGAGTHDLTPAGSVDAFVLKLNNSGSFVWAQQIGATGGTFGDCIAINPVDNGIYILGDFNGTTDFDPGFGVFNLTSMGEADLFISKLNSSGNFLWVQTAGGIENEVGWSMTIDVSENIYTTGFFNSPSLAFGSSVLINVDTDSIPTFDIFIAKLDTIMTGMNEVEKSASSKIFPNPFHQAASLSINTDNFTGGTLEIKNILGEAIAQPKHFTGNTIQLHRNNLPAGIYFYRITAKDNKILNGKFIIE